MAYTLEQYTELQAAIAMGALVVRHNDRTVTYRSLDEMQRILRMMAQELGVNENNSNGGRRLAAFSKGY
ncbi:phage head-tail joining protein [Pseudomonas leptonychotis]|uniref:phage head-tail joining protein n=1 Tax=Pseudomonas leptonychotis TaxID=2448482 RepID=UPI003865E08E